MRVWREQHLSVTAKVAIRQSSTSAIALAYALAKETGEELLFKGTDFALTDIAVAPY